MRLARTCTVRSASEDESGRAHPYLFHVNKRARRGHARIHLTSSTIQHMCDRHGAAAGFVMLPWPECDSRR